MLPKKSGFRKTGSRFFLLYCGRFIQPVISVLLFGTNPAKNRTKRRIKTAFVLLQLYK